MPDEIVAERDRWPRGIVRHLRLDPSTPPGEGFAIREDHNGGLAVKGGSVDIHYTLVLHPKHKDKIESIRSRLERNPALGGVFSPPRDARKEKTRDKHGPIL